MIPSQSVSALIVSPFVRQDCRRACYVGRRGTVTVLRRLLRGSEPQVIPISYAWSDRASATVTGPCRPTYRDGEDSTFTRTLSTLPLLGLFGYARARPDGARARVAMMDTEVSEATEVMARYCRVELAAFHRFYALLAPRILAYLTGMLGDRASGEDALQATFLKIHEARAMYVLGAN